MDLLDGLMNVIKVSMILTVPVSLQGYRQFMTVYPTIKDLCKFSLA
jgi:hypothetical protein